MVVTTSGGALLGQAVWRVSSQAPFYFSLLSSEVNLLFLLLVGTSFVLRCSACGERRHPRLVCRALVFGVEFAGLLENPTVPVGMVSRLPGSTVYLTYLVQDFVEVG